MIKTIFIFFKFLFARENKRKSDDFLKITTNKAEINKKIFENKIQIKGHIAYYKLTEWWLSEFSDEERDTIIKITSPMYGVREEYDELKNKKILKSGLTDGELNYSSQSDLALLTNLSGWFDNKDNKPIAFKFLKKAEEMLFSNNNIIDHHFFYSEKIQTFYKERENKAFYDASIDACKKQIEIAPAASVAFLKKDKEMGLPSHKGYNQLAIIFEKNKDFDSAIDLCNQAKNQGWQGDWDKRIERCKIKKLKHNLT